MGFLSSEEMTGKPYSRTTYEVALSCRLKKFIDDAIGTAPHTTHHGWLHRSVFGIVAVVPSKAKFCRIGALSPISILCNYVQPLNHQ